MGEICPYCKKKFCIPDVVGRNVEAYGTKTVNFRCLHCRKVIKASGQRVVYIRHLTKTDQAPDW